MSAASIPVGDQADLVSLFGTRDRHIRQIRELLQVDISTRDGAILVSGEKLAVAQATEVLEQLKKIVARSGQIQSEEVQSTLARVTGSDSSEGPTIFSDQQIECPGRTVHPKTAGQKRYVQAIREHDIVLCLGPAGTGKTYLAVALAVEALKQQLIRKIVLVRPAVEAGESLGFLPGDLQAKINPYLRPLLDALREMLDYDVIKRYREEDTIEMIPLAYMRGRTLNDSFIILDEAQNTTTAQMKMFLTRMGTNSKIVVSGDTTQVDLERNTRSGLLDAFERLKNIRGVKQLELADGDIVRHRLVQDIVRAYDKGGKRR